ncbi:TPA: P2 family phage major capsid protein [Yersinia enterocolitica]|nr:P2 family phage major capsid protein [Yersinia enterocolitica]
MKTSRMETLSDRYHAQFTSQAQPFGSSGAFTLPESAENELRLVTLESAWMMENITLQDVEQQSGQAVYVGDSSLHTGRAIQGRFYKPLSVNGTPYTLVETDSCASLPYDRMSMVANIGDFAHFNQTVDDFFGQAIALDVLRVGLNGTRTAYPTNPTENPKGEDVNKGWHTLAKEYEDGQQVLTRPVTLGAGGDFPHLDALASHLITTLIPEGMRENPRLVVMVGAELAAAERLRLFNAADRPSDIAAAAQMVNSSVAGRFAFIPPFMPGKRLAITTLENLHVYTLKGSRIFRAEFVEDRASYERSYLRYEGYGLGDATLYAAVDESAISFIPAQK